MILPEFAALPPYLSPIRSLQAGKPWQPYVHSLSKFRVLSRAIPISQPSNSASKPTTARSGLEGTVGSFYQKQMAQEVVRRLDGVQGIENQLQVSWS